MSIALKNSNIIWSSGGNDMNKYVIYKEFGRLKLTNEANYNTCMRNASQVIDVNNFSSADSVRDYLIREWRLFPHQIIDKTND